MYPIISMVYLSILRNLLLGYLSTALPKAPAIRIRHTSAPKSYRMIDPVHLPLSHSKLNPMFYYVLSLQDFLYSFKIMPPLSHTNTFETQ